jgi:ankyrin repeat protein
MEKQLIDAVEAANLDRVVKLLIDHDDDLDLHEPLICAVESGHVDIAKALIEHDADTNAFDAPLWRFSPKNNSKTKTKGGGGGMHDSAKHVLAL